MVSVLIKVSPEYKGTKVSYFSDSKDEAVVSVSAVPEEEDFGVTMRALVDDSSSFPITFFEMKNKPAITAAASTNNNGTVLDFIFYLLYVEKIATILNADVRIERIVVTIGAY